MKKILLILILYLTFSSAQSIETRIVHKIQNEIITNIDIKNEFKYLLALNNALKELDKEKIFNISNESIIREKIKKIEILTNYKELKINEAYSDIILKNIYSNLNIIKIRMLDSMFVFDSMFVNLTVYRCSTRPAEAKRGGALCDGTRRHDARHHDCDWQYIRQHVRARWI